MFRIFLVRQYNFYEPFFFARVFFIKIQKIKKGSIQNEPRRPCINFYIKSFSVGPNTRRLIPKR